MRRFALAAALILAPLPALAQETLADIRQDLSVLTVELQRLQRELSTTGGAGVNIAGSTLDRVNAIEAELQRLTNRTEEMQFRIDSVVRDGTNRIGDLEFRLCELEDGCDIGSLGQTAPLGGTAPATSGSGPIMSGGPSLDGQPLPTDGTATVADIETAPGAGTGTGAEALPSGGAQLAVNEEQDFRRAQEALASGDFQSAANLFETYRQTYPGGPLDAAALVGRGRALEGAGDTRGAAQAYLDAYSAYPQSEVAPVALWKLGAALGALGSVSEACVTLAEVGNRFPGDAAVAEAQAARSQLPCP
ncbi:tol-pal system protein YbgF [Litorisediminicola beolgyonensis]|uniref:Cell division coordinator CpoB n=1 Tax=Litorisediminicola beolgyonensis TaxID=1173614 RepID=A0ABW3ZMY3_9RHOB